MKWMIPILLGGLLAGGVYCSRARADPQIQEERVPVPFEFGTYEYSLRASVLGSGIVDGATVSIGFHDVSGPVFGSSLDEHVARVSETYIGGLYELSLSFQLHDSVVGKAAGVLLDDSLVKSVVRQRGDGSFLPVACSIRNGSHESYDVSELLYDEEDSEVVVTRNGSSRGVHLSREQFVSLVTPSSLIPRIIMTPARAHGEEVFLGRFVDPVTLRVEDVVSSISRVRSRDVSAECIQGFGGDSLLMGSTVTPPSVFGGASARVMTYYTVHNPDGSCSVPLKGCLSFEVVGGGLALRLADVSSSAYTSFVRFLGDER